MQTVLLFLFFISSAHASPNIPYVDKYGGVVIEEDKDHTVSISSCSIEKTEIKYLGSSPLCKQTMNCRRHESSKVAIVEPSDLIIRGFCSISSESAGCRSKTWKDCVMDRSTPDHLDEDCLSNRPEPSKPNCPKLNAEGASQKREDGARR